MNKKFIYLLVVILILFSACNPPLNIKPPLTEPASATQTVDPPIISTPTELPATRTPLPKAVSPISLEQPFAKAAFQEGPFDFEVYLYQDPGFSKNPTMTWMYSDIPGVGSHVAWKYHGSGIKDPVVESWGTCPDVSPRDTYPSLQDGASSIREGGILLPQNAAAGTVVQFVFKLEASHGTYGGILSFLLTQGSQGLEPSKVTVYGLDQPLEANGCVA